MNPEYWSFTADGGWELQVNAEVLSKVVADLDAALNLKNPVDFMTSLPPRAILASAKDMLETFPAGYVATIGEMFLSPDNLLSFEDTVLTRGGLSSDGLRSLTRADLEKLAENLKRRIRFVLIRTQFRPEANPFTNGALTLDDGYVVDPFANEYQVSILGEYIEFL